MLAGLLMVAGAVNPGNGSVFLSAGPRRKARAYREHPDGPRVAKVLRQNRKPPKPMSEEERALWVARSPCAECYRRAGGKPNCREECPVPAANTATRELTARYWPLVREVVKSLLAVRKMPERIESEDIESACAVRFSIAVRRFSLEEGVSPKTYIARNIQWEAADAMRRMCVLPSETWHRLKEAREAVAADEIPSADARASLAAAELEASAQSPMCLHEPVGGDGEVNRTRSCIADIIIDENSDFQSRVDAADAVRHLRPKLSPMELIAAEEMGLARDELDGVTRTGLSFAAWRDLVAWTRAKLKRLVHEEGWDA